MAKQCCNASVNETMPFKSFMTVGNTHITKAGLISSEIIENGVYEYNNLQSSAHLL